MTIRFTAAHGRMLAAGATLLALTAACAKKDAATDTTSATTASTTSSTAMTQSQKEDLHDAIHGYTLTEDNVNKVISATQKMEALQKAHPELAAMQENHGGSDSKSVDDAAAKLDAMPPVHAVFSSVGLSARDYVLTMFTLMEAGAAYQMQKAGKLPPNSELAKDVSPANIAYVGAHQAQLEALEKANSAANGGE